jgi:multidrug efflux pump subunit AcrA (membrane-fusion protein)
MRRIPYIPAVVGAAMLLLMTGATVFIACSKKKEVSSPAGQEVIYHCPMHPNYLSRQPGACPICGMNLVPVNNSGPQEEKGKDAGSGVRIDPAMIQSIGVQTEKAALRTQARDIRTSATVMPDERRITMITTKIMGYVEKLYVNYTGQRVSQGQPLFDLYSPELVSAQSEYLQAYRNLASQDSGQLLRSARQRLLNWDVTEAQIAALEKRGVPEKTITVVSSVTGNVTEKMIVEGQSIEPGMQLYKVIDYSGVWVEGAVYQQDMPFVTVGQRGAIELDYYPGEQFAGTVTYVAPDVNMESRTLMVRLELANTSGLKIKPGMNATVTLHAVMKRRAVTVPEQAVIRSGSRSLVIIARGGGYFEPREIKIGQTAGGYTEVMDGVLEGEEIVVSSQFLIDSESNLKAAVMKMAARKDSSGQKPPSLHADKKMQMKRIYTCPMHPEVISDGPGKCPKCGMNLVLKKTEAEKKSAGPDTGSGMDRSM